MGGNVVMDDRGTRREGQLDRGSRRHTGLGQGINGDRDVGGANGAGDVEVGDPHGSRVSGLTRLRLVYGRKALAHGQPGQVGAAADVWPEGAQRLAAGITG